jgi:hypothetical protein
MDWDPKINKDPVEKKTWLASSKNTFGFKDEAKQTVSSSLQNTLSNYFLKWSRQMIKFILSKQETSNKAKSKRENKSRVSGIESFIPGNDAKKCCRPNTHLGYCGRNLQSTWCVLGGKSRVKVLSPDPQLLRLGQLLAKPRGVVPIKRI